jgi:hypothetical protein
MARLIAVARGSKDGPMSPLECAIAASGLREAINLRSHPVGLTLRCKTMVLSSISETWFYDKVSARCIRGNHNLCCVVCICYGKLSSILRTNARRICPKGDSN